MPPASAAGRTAERKTPRAGSPVGAFWFSGLTENRLIAPLAPGLFQTAAVAGTGHHNRLQAACSAQRVTVANEQPGRHDSIIAAHKMPLDDPGQTLAPVQWLKRSGQRAELLQRHPLTRAEVPGQRLHLRHILALAGQQQR